MHQAHAKHEEDEVSFAGLINSSSISISADTPGPASGKAAVQGKATGHSRTTHITVRTFTDSSGGASTLSAIEEQQEQQLLARACSSGSQESAGDCEEWYDCTEEWQEDEAGAAASTQEQQQAAEELLAALPADLAHILRRYLQVCMLQAQCCWVLRL
jgi:hypothetical protein